MSIYTGKGDGGSSSLADGTRVSKASARLEACGALDEAATLVGFARSAITHQLLADLLDFAVQRLTTCAAILGAGDAPELRISPEDVDSLEGAIDRLEEHTGPLKGFIALKGSDTAMRLHMARAVVRKAERRIVALHESEPVEPELLAFVNRLSDALFAAARFANVADGVAEEAWDPGSHRPTF